MPFKVWAIGEEVLAADFNDYVQEQVVGTFPTAGARDGAITVPLPGMVAYTADTHSLSLYDGGAWRPLTAFPKYSVAINAGTIGTSLLPLTNTLTVPNLAYPHRLRCMATVGWSAVGSTAGSICETRMQYDTTGASPAAGAPSLRTNIWAAPIASTSGSSVLIAHLDRPAGGSTAFILRGIMSSGSASTRPGSDYSGFDVVAEPM